MKELWLGSLVFLLACTTQQKAMTEAELKEEFRALAHYYSRLGEQYNHDPFAFRNLSKPWGPLSLSVKNATSQEEANGLRNYNFGLASAAFRVPPKSIERSLFCDRECQEKRQSLLQEISQMGKDIVSEFNKLDKVYLVSQWGLSNSYRINDTFVNNNVALEALPSQRAGFLPSGKFKTLDSAPSDALPIVEKLRKLGASAIYRQPDGNVRIIFDGYSDNEIGLFFNTASTDVIEIGKVLPDMKEVSAVNKVESEIYYYETN